MMQAFVEQSGAPIPEALKTLIESGTSPSTGPTTPARPGRPDHPHGRHLRRGRPGQVDADPGPSAYDPTPSWSSCMDDVLPIEEAKPLRRTERDKPDATDAYRRNVDAPGRRPSTRHGPAGRPGGATLPGLEPAKEKSRDRKEHRKEVGRCRSVYSLSDYVVQIITGLGTGPVLFLVSAGLTLVFGALRMINFAHGSLSMLGALLRLSLAARSASGTHLLGGLPPRGLVVAAGGMLMEISSSARSTAARCSRSCSSRSRSS